MKQKTLKLKMGEVEGLETPYGVIALIDPRWLDVDNGVDGYQRPFNRKWAERIASEWDRAKARPSSARIREGRLYLTNGQHTANAAVLAGEDKVLVIINNGNPSREREAIEFVDQQTRVKRVSSFDEYRAALVARVDDALVLRKVATELGIEVSDTKGPRSLTAIKGARQIAQGGEEQLRDVLEIALVWSEEDPARFQYAILKGIEKALYQYDKESLVKSAKRRTATGLLKKATEEGGNKGFVVISNIAAELGKGVRRTKRIPSVVHEG